MIFLSTSGLILLQGYPRAVTLSLTEPKCPTMAPFNLDACISQLLKKQLLHETVLKEICEKTKEVLMTEGNVVHIQAPVTVVGDIHGSALQLGVY